MGKVQSCFFQLEIQIQSISRVKKQIYSSESSVQNVNILLKTIGVWKGFTTRNFKSNSSKDY